MFVDTKYRSSAPEIMDDFKLEGEVLKDALDKIASINRMLGGNKVTIEGVLKLLQRKPKEISGRTIRILDIGCGNGDMLRALARHKQLRGLKLQLIGIDANLFTIRHAESLSEEYSNITYHCADIFEWLKDETPKSTHLDIVVCTLTLHHFLDKDILRLISTLHRKTSAGIVVNDLHRNALAYYLFKGLCLLFGLNDMSREDGLVSILRGFKKKDLEYYSANLGLKNRTIKWKWAFRYQWIIW